MRDLCTVSHLILHYYRIGDLHTFSLSEKYGLERREFYRFLHMWHYYIKEVKGLIEQGRTL